MKKPILLLIAILFLGAHAAAPAFGQTDQILVAGKQPLSQANVDRVIELYEWALEVDFTARERRTFQKFFVDAWRRGDKTAAGLLKMAEKILALDETKRREAQPEFRRAFLADFKAAPELETSRFLLAIYERAHGSETAAVAAGNIAPESETTDRKPTEAENAARAEPDYKPIEGAIKISDLTGKWSKASVSSYGYRNTVTNDYRSGYGFANQHEIQANGNFDYSNFATVSGYGCTTELFTNMKGRVSASGSQVTFTYVSGTVKIKDSCKKNETTKPAQIRTTIFRVERGADGLRMCEVGAETPYCLYQVKEK